MKTWLTAILVCIACLMASAGNVFAGDDLRLDCKMKSGRVDARMKTQRIGQADVVEEEKVENLTLVEAKGAGKQTVEPVKTLRESNRKRRLTSVNED